MRIFSCSRRHAKISLKFTDKVPFFADLSVSKTYFTDKPSFFGDLSVNFWPLWGEFTDRRLFLGHLSVKPRSKPPKSYGQTAIFDHFVRNRYFSSGPFTDKEPIFIDLSVNGSDFAKGSAAHHLLNHCTWPRLRAKRCFLEFARNLRPHGFGEGNRVEHFSEFWRFCSTFGSAHPEFGPAGRQKWGIHPGFCLLLVPRAPNFDKLVDKNEAFIPFFVYFRIRTGRIWRVK